MDFKLPDIGEGIHEGEVVKWLVKEGDVVKEDQPIVQVMTDKATVEIPSPTAGRIAKIMAAEGKVALVGSVLVTIEAGGAAPAKAPPAAAAPAKAAPPAAAATTKIAPANGPSHAAAGGGPPKVGTDTMIAREAARAAVEAQAAVAGPAARKVNGKVLAAPATRKLAREMGVELGTVTGSGPNGRVTKDDLKLFVTAPTKVLATPAAARAPMPIASSAEDERVPLRGLRKIIAESMHRSKSTAAHYTYVEEVDVTELVAFRASAKKTAEQRGARLTYLPFIIKAVCVGLKEFPYVNSSLDEVAGEIVLKKSYHIGVAAATDEGLMVPVVRDCDKKGLIE